MSSIIEYMWVKVFEDIDGIEKFIPQFRSDGTQQFWNDSKDVKLKKLVITPIGKDLAFNMQAKKIPGVSVPLPEFIFTILPSDSVKAYWDNEIQITNHFYCRTCGTQWKHLDSSKWAQCPKCGQMDEWSCSRCNRFISPSDVTTNARGETNCPYCEVPHGLNRVRHLERIQDVIENTDYVIEFSGKFKLTIRQTKVDIESL